MTTDVHELAGAYALDALDEEERRSFERHLDDCGDCRVEVDEFQATGALLGTIADEEPPPGMRDRLLAAVAATPQAAPERAPVALPAQEEVPAQAGVPVQAGVPASAPVDELKGRRERLRQLLPAVAAVIVLGVAGVTVVVTQTGTEPAADDQLAEAVAAPDARIVDLAAPDGATARLVWSDERGGGVFVTDGLAAAPSGHAYALWVIEAETPVLLGMFQPDEVGHASHRIDDQPPAGLTVAVTVEEEAGVQAPTTDPIIVGEL
ncbi:MAG: anti-sigma factor [Egibacteraceae bacterium]